MDISYWQEEDYGTRLPTVLLHSVFSLLLYSIIVVLLLQIIVASDLLRQRSHCQITGTENILLTVHATILDENKCL